MQSTCFTVDSRKVYVTVSQTRSWKSDKSLIDKILNGQIRCLSSGKNFAFLGNQVGPF